MSDKVDKEEYYENLGIGPDEVKEGIESFKSLNDFPRAPPPMQNPLGDMIKGLTSMVTGRPPMSQKLTLSGPVGEGTISIEITDSFTASMAHDIINKIMDEKRGKTNMGKGKSEQDIFEAMMKDSKKSSLLD